YEALPRLVFVALGGWLGWQFLGPWLAPHLESTLAASVQGSKVVGPEVVPWMVRVTGVMAGMGIGWLLNDPLNQFLGGFFWLFNVGFNTSTNLYTRIIGMLLRISALVLLVYGGLLYLTFWGFTHTPSGFIPTQDKGYLLVNVQLPDSTSLERTQKVMQRVEEIASKVPGVAHTVGISGQSILLNSNAPNFGSLYVMLDEFHHRTRPDLSGDAVASRLQEECQDEIQDGLINVFGAPPVEGLGTAGGFKVVIEDRGDLGPQALQTVADRVVAVGNNDRALQGLFTSFRANTPWLFLDLDRQKVKVMNVSMAEVFNALQVYLGSLYVNDFNRFGRTWQVNVQGDANFRKQIEDLKQLKIRNESGGMAPLGSMASIRDVSGPVLIMRYNMYPSAAINGDAAPGVSSGQAIEAMQRLVEPELSQSMRYQWTELAYLQLQTGSTAMFAFLLAVVLVFLVLAAQYESWSLPLAVILVVPMCLLCSVTGVQAAQMDINIFTQVGFIVLVGLACKNAILIVEFAKARREAGVPRNQATLQACQLRLRPIMMTSLAFILGVVPLVMSIGAGAEMRRTLGTAVFSGMLGVTLFGIFLTPVFYSVIQWFNDRFGNNRPRLEAEK
ncbi:MAG: efflux RND transporter permease subunit, partial [Planctomycetaceae bacterium]|nr:efflux RND transporter permease subunit [Planctomycetaceae bacterium]